MVTYLAVFVVVGVILCCVPRSFKVTHGCLSQRGVAIPRYIACHIFKVKIIFCSAGSVVDEC